jgi:hypothetical protein
MAVAQASIQSFVLRIWLEELQQEDGRSRWRGHITDIATGERRYVEDLDGIVAFLVPRLELMGAHVGLRWRLHNWLARSPSDRRLNT